MSTPSASTPVPASRTIRIPEDLNGPYGSANGGVAAGMLAQLLDGPATVRLHRPPPLGEDLGVHAEDGVLHAHASDGHVVLSASPSARPEVAVPRLDPAAVTAGEAVDEHSAARCVICGPAHPRGLRVFPAPVDGADVFATRWTPPAWALDDAGVMPTELVWGVLDCPGGWMIAETASEPLFPALGTITAEVRRPIRGDESVLVAAWSLGREGRKHHTATAILGETGDVLAVARQTCIAVPPAWAAGQHQE